MPGLSRQEPTLDAQRSRLEHRGRLNGVHWFAIGLSMAFTLFAWRYSVVLVDTRAQTQFERHASQVVELVRARLDHYATALRGGVGLVQASRQVSLHEWHRYTDSLGLAERFPALHVFGIAYRVRTDELERFAGEQRAFYPDFDLSPAHEDPVLLPISLVWPARFESGAIGLDLAREPIRRQAVERSFSLGTAQLTGPVALGVSGRQGLILIDAFSDVGDTSFSAGSDGGVAMAVVLTSKLLDGLSAELGSHLAIRLSDQDGPIHQDEDYASVASSARFASEPAVSVHGRDWVFDLSSTPLFDREAMLWIPSAVLVAGLLLNALVLTLFLSLSRSNRTALRYAARAGRALSHEREELATINRELSAANSELECFGHALSHDLRTPLNGIQSMVEFAIEDLAETGLDRRERENIESHLDRAQRQVVRGKALITGMLDYTGLGATTPTASRVDVHELLNDIGDGLRLGPDQLRVPDGLPVMHTCETRLGQVFSNLIGNAVKYHPSPGTAVIDIEACECEQGGMVRFAVDDDGDGIEPQYRDRAFELFGKVHTRTDVESSGVGLSIVRKSVEQVGGTVAIEQAASGGARVVFTWPHEPSEAA